MIDKSLLNEIDKTMKFVLKRITEGRMIVKKINDEKKLFIIIKNGDYKIKEFNIDSGISYSDVLILGEEDATIEEFKSIVEKEEHVLDNGGLIIIKHIISNEEHMDSVKENILEILKGKGIEAIKVYFAYSKTEVDNNSLSVVIIGRKHLDLLQDSPEYEEYSNNVVADKKCGGCSSGGCNGKKCCKK